jgi:acetyl esterase/lipase
MSVFHRRLGLLLCVAALLSGKYSGADAGENASSTSTFSATEIAPPAADTRSIALPGKRAGAIPESWLDIDNPHDRSGFAGPSILRNVSQASITPFLPEKGKATGAAVIVAPGGGGVELSMELQGYQVARWLTQQGIAAFVLKYRLVPTPGETSKFLDLITRESGTALEGVVSARDAADAEAAAREDGLDAVSYIRSHASQWHVRPDRIGLVGFSSGAFTSINVVLASDEHNRPNLVALVYGALADWNEKIPSSAPPAFIAASTDDHQVPAVQGLMIYKAWVQAGIPAELHVFETGGHGFAVNKSGKGSDQWLGLFEHWLREHDFAPIKPH